MIISLWQVQMREEANLDHLLQAKERRDVSLLFLNLCTPLLISAPLKSIESIRLF